MIDTRDQLRSVILDSIEQLLSKRIILDLMTQDQLDVLQAERKFWSGDDDALDKLLVVLKLHLKNKGESN